MYLIWKYIQGQRYSMFNKNSSNMKPKTIKNLPTFTREQLYKLVWSKSIRSIASEYNIPESSLKKKSKNDDIPLQHLGH